MMKLSKRTEYGIRALVEMARREDRPTEWLQISHIARKTKIPEKFLEQILLSLRNQGFLRSRRGVDGGYALNRRPKDISLSALIESLEGPGGQNSGTDERRGGTEETYLVVREVMQEAEAAANKVLSRTTLHDLAEAANLQSADRAAQEYEI